MIVIGGGNEVCMNSDLGFSNGTPHFVDLINDSVHVLGRLHSDSLELSLNGLKPIDEPNVARKGRANFGV